MSDPLQEKALPPISIQRSGISRKTLDARKSLETVLAGQFGEVSHAGRNFKTQQSTVSSFAEDDPGLTTTPLVPLTRHERWSAKINRLLESSAWITFFMILTFYALFSSDFDQWLGTKGSKYALSIMTTVVFFLFLVEIVLASYARRGYCLRPFFWLDIVSCVSLLPDTWFAGILFQSNSFVAGRSSRLTRLIRIVARSSRATRLNRLMRVARLAAILPRLLMLCWTKKDDQEALRLVDRKLQRIFNVLDEDNDGSITQERMEDCLLKLSAGKSTQSMLSMAVSRSKSMLSRGTQSSRDTRPSIPSPSSGEESPNGVGSGSPRGSAVTPTATTRHPSRKVIRNTSRQRTVGTPTSVRFQELDDGEQWDPAGPRMSPRNTSTPGSGRSSNRHSTAAFSHADEDEEMIDYAEFKRKILQDEWISGALLRACREQILRGNNASNIASSQTEDIGVSVALGILVILLVVIVVTPATTDYSYDLGLGILSNQAARLGISAGVQIPLALQDNVLLFTSQPFGSVPQSFDLVYLDLNRVVFCDKLRGIACSQPRGYPVNGTARVSLEAIDDQISESDWRQDDLSLYRFPDSSQMDVTSSDALNQLTMAVLLVNYKSSNQYQAQMSLLTTVTVIVIILVGVGVLTRDLGSISRNLLQPLRALADEMMSIGELQLAGFSNESATNAEKGTAEVRMMQKMFDNTKKAIRSWGKYVPWPVVKILLAAGVDAEKKVTEKEVTIFFSDIAGFTTIVEKLRPEQSLQLLSKYFNTMSKVIDDEDGIVIEFIGDAILSVFGAPLRNPEHAEKTVKATLKMLAALEKINKWSSRLPEPLPEVSIRCGIHTGPVLIGNMGYTNRMKYGIVGEHANIPGRLEEMNKNYGTNMLISQRTYDKIPCDDYVVRPIDYVKVRHGEGCEPEYVYQVLRHRAGGASKLAQSLSPLADKHTEAMECYRSREFEKAAQIFSEVSVGMEELTGTEDAASILLMKRCKAYARSPPREDWDGVWDRSDEP